MWLLNTGCQIDFWISNFVAKIFCTFYGIWNGHTLGCCQKYWLKYVNFIFLSDPSSGLFNTNHTVCAWGGNIHSKSYGQWIRVSESDALFGSPLKLSIAKRKLNKDGEADGDFHWQLPRSLEQMKKEWLEFPARLKSLAVTVLLV